VKEKTIRVLPQEMLIDDISGIQASSSKIPFLTAFFQYNEEGKATQETRGNSKGDNNNLCESRSGSRIEGRKDSAYKILFSTTSLGES
jgi:hypothetical protein